MGRSKFALLVAVGLASCANVSTKFPPGLAPVDLTNLAPLPVANNADPYPETFNGVYGNTHGYDWGHAQGYIKAPIAIVWAAIKDPQVVADRRSADKLSYVMNIDPTYDFSYQLHYYVSDDLVEWEENWRYGVIEGTDDAPLEIVNSNQKVWGTEYIRIDAGSMLIQSVAADLTLIGVMEHLDATGSDTSNISQYYKDFFASVTARAHGMPLPTY